MKTIKSYFNEIIYLNNYTLTEKFTICFLGALCLTCLTLLLFAFCVIGGEVLGVSLASFPLLFVVDVEKGKGDRADKIRRMKSVLNDTCELWFNNILIAGGKEIKESRKDMTESKKNSYYGSNTETTLSQINVVKPPKSLEDMTILLDGFKNIWGDSVLFCVVSGKATSLDKLIEFNNTQKNK